MTVSVLVVGRGPAGLLSASYLRQRGFDVTILADADGTMSMWSGDFGFGRSADAFESFPVKLSQSSWVAAFQGLVDIFDSFGVPLRLAPPGVILRTVTATGNLRPTFAVPAWQYASVDPEDLIIVGIAGLADSIADAQAVSYRNHVRREAIVVKLTRPPGWDPGWGAIRFASYLDTRAGLAWFTRELGAQLRHAPRGAPVIVPQILGLDTTVEIVAHLAGELGHPIAEFPLLSPSVGGVRIRDRWERSLRRLGVHFITGRAQRVSPTATAMTDDGREFAADYVLLATGGVLGGGASVTIDGAIIDDLVNRELGKMDDVQSLDRVGHPDIDCIGGGRVLAVGRALGGWNPNKDHNGGAMVLGSVHMALSMISED